MILDFIKYLNFVFSVSSSCCILMCPLSAFPVPNSYFIAHNENIQLEYILLLRFYFANNAANYTSTAKLPIFVEEPQHGKQISALRHKINQLLEC